jgi:hypothetical protein
MQFSPAAGEPAGVCHIMQQAEDEKLGSRFGELTNLLRQPNR